MRVVSRKPIDEFIRKHTDAKDALLTWFYEAQKAQWKTPQDIKDRYASASILADNTVVFNIKGNHYRLGVRVAYNTGVVTVQWAKTHAEYSKMKKG
jgi:mRNA interferase HigB